MEVQTFFAILASVATPIIAGATPVGMSLLLAETDTNTTVMGVVTTVFGFFSLVFTGVMAYRMARLSRKVEASQAAVKETLEKRPPNDWPDPGTVIVGQSIRVLFS